MTKKEQKHTCPTWGAIEVDNIFRKMLHNPKKILKTFIKEGMTVLDIGCDPCFFSLEMAKMLNMIKTNGFTIIETPKVFFSRAIVVSK